MAKVREKLYVTVPSPFRCPISMDVMRSPVSLCTGITYDRSSIQHWLDSGHDTCPATMQVLPSKDFIPNLTLHRLIRLWLLSAAAEPSSPGSPLSGNRLRALFAGIQSGAADLAASLSEIAGFARFSGENRRLLASFPGFDSTIVRALTESRSRIEASENAIAILDLVFRENGDAGVAGERIRRSILDAREDCFATIAFVLEIGSAKSKIESARVLEFLAGDFQSKRWIAETQGLLSLLSKILNDGSDELNDAVLSLLAAVSATQSAKAELVRSGIVEAVSKKLRSATCGGSTAEKCLRMLAVVATCAEGRAVMAGDPSCAAAVTERLAKAGKKAAEEDAVAVLWSLCCLCGNERVRDEVAKQNGVAVVLLVMQRGCGEHVRSMCVDLIKVLRKSATLALGTSYDTKTTHIKPC